MPRIPIVFGGGLDREIGVMAMTTGGMEDLRNVHIMQGKFQSQLDQGIEQLPAVVRQAVQATDTFQSDANQ